MNVPNSLSFLRILLIPVFCIAFLSGEEYYIPAGIALALSGLSDMLDGFFARRLNQITELGKWLDPIADKLTLGAVVVCMWINMHDEIPILTPVFAILILKELAMAIGGMIVVRGLDHMLPSQIWGKIGTACFYTCMLAIVIISMFDLGGEYSSHIIIALAVISALVMIYAFIRYCIFGVEVLRAKKQKKNDETAAAASEAN